MNPEVWGPKAWFFIHNVALAYPKNPTDEDKQNYKVFFVSMGNVLPCSICVEHYEKNFVVAELEEALVNRASLFRFTVDLHNKVNEMNGKRKVSYEEALKGIQNQYDNQRSYGFLILLIVVGLIVYKLHKAQNKS